MTMIPVPQRALVSRLCHYRMGTGGPEPTSAARHALTNRFDISSAATSPSLGLLDMVAALTRVRGNIRAFG
jgi:carboxylesterase type B